MVSDILAAMAQEANPFGFQRQPPAPVEQQIASLAEQCKDILPRLEDLGAALCLAGRIDAASRLTSATAQLIRELNRHGRLG